MPVMLRIFAARVLCAASVAAGSAAIALAADDRSPQADCTALLKASTAPCAFSLSIAG
jgi:hypothetical protein